MTNQHLLITRVLGLDNVMSQHMHEHKQSKKCANM